MNQSIILEAQPRELMGKKTRRLRRQGITPIHLYGRGTEPLSLQVDTALLQRTLSKAGTTTILSVQVNGRDYMAVVRLIQRHPASGNLLHVDFLHVSATERMRAEIPLHLVGEAPAVRLRSGVLAQALHTLLVEALPLELPRELEVSVSGLDSFEKVVRVADIAVAAGVTVLTNPEDVVARVMPPRVAEEAAPEAKPAEGEPAASAEEEPAAGESQR